MMGAAQSLLSSVEGSLSWTIKPLVFHPPSAHDGFIPINSYLQWETVQIDAKRKTLMYWVGKDKQTTGSIYPSLTSLGKVIVLSHGNACNIEMMYTLAHELHKQTGLPVVVYEYLGYNGLIGEESPSEEGCYDSLLATLKHLNLYYRIDYRNMILFGISLGTGVSVGAAHRLAQNDQPVGALVLQSPFLSISQTQTESSFASLVDMFPTWKNIAYVDCPVYIIHGNKDQVVPISHGERLFESIRLLNNLNRMTIVYGGNHDEIVERMGTDYFDRIKKFLDSLENNSRATYKN